jgi:hypothetical protein
VAAIRPAVPQNHQGHGLIVVAMMNNDIEFVHHKIIIRTDQHAVPGYQTLG